MNFWKDMERDAMLEAIDARLSRIEQALLAVVAYITQDTEDEITFDLDGNANRPDRDPNETL